ncbi:MAG: hypothetical protein LBC70_03535 [Chitinispirillales bacterium]|jgi:hypothetical protein|nr:hypothetical protein [Chitinispirillales bacterium]
MNKKVISDWKIERYLLGELPEGEMEALRAQEESDLSLQKKIAELRASDAELLGRHPPEVMARKIDAAVDSKKHAAPKPSRFVLTGKAAGTSLLHGWKGIPRWAVIPAFACALVLLTLPLRLIPSVPVKDDGAELALLPGDADDGTRIKGFESRLEVWRKVGASAERLAPGADAAQGDVVQLRYLVPEPCYGTIVSIDGRGHLTVHLSGEAGRAIPLTPGRPVALEHSYELDDAQKFEIFYLITASQNFNTDTAAQSLLKSNNKHRPSLPRGQQVTIFALRKIGG